MLHEEEALPLLQEREDGRLGSVGVEAVGAWSQSRSRSSIAVGVGVSVGVGNAGLGELSYQNEDASTSSNMLPKDVFISVFSFLDCRDLAVCAALCTSW